MKKHYTGGLGPGKLKKLGVKAHREFGQDSSDMDRKRESAR